MRKVDPECKSKLRKSQRKGWLISLMTFKKYIDEIIIYLLEGSLVQLWRGDKSYKLINFTQKI